MEKLRIVQVVGDGTTTGAPRHVLLLSTELKRRGHNVLAIAPPGPIVKSLEAAGVKTAKIVMRSPLDRRADHEIRATAARFKPDVIHCHGTRGGWLGRLAARKIKHTALVYTEHLWTKDYAIGNPVWHEFQTRGLRYMDRFTDVTIAVSKSVKDFLVANHITPPGRIVIVGNMLDPCFSTVTRYKKPSEMPQIIGTVGSLNQQKGHLLLLDALVLLNKQKLPYQWRCQIIGAGPLEGEVKKRIRRLRLHGKVALMGKFDDICTAMRHFTYYVQYSRTESFGMAAMEAMALEIPTIVSNRGALPEIVKTDETGIVVPYNQPAKLADAIVKLMCDQKLCERLGQQARREVLEKYSNHKIVDHIERVYLRAIKHRQFLRDYSNR